MNALYFALGLSFFCVLGRASLCESEMAKFRRVSPPRIASLCARFKDDGLFSQFKACLFGAAKSYNRGNTEEVLYQAEEADLQGLVQLCGGSFGAIAKPSERKPATKH